MLPLPSSNDDALAQFFESMKAEVSQSLKLPKLFIGCDPAADADVTGMATYSIKAKSFELIEPISSSDIDAAHATFGKHLEKLREKLMASFINPGFHYLANHALSDIDAEVRAIMGDDYVEGMNADKLYYIRLARM